MKFIGQKLASVVSFEICKEISKNMQILIFEIKKLKNEFFEISLQISNETTEMSFCPMNFI